MNPMIPRADQLSLQRTRLANERTLLAYVRTSLTLLGGGIASLELIEPGWTRSAGFGFLAAGVAMLIIGFWRYIAVNRTLVE